MELDIERIGIVRSALGLEAGPMDFLLSRIRRDLEHRIETMEKGPSQGLVIDFLSGDLSFGSMDQRVDLSLLESGHQGIEELGSLNSASFDCVIINLQMAWLDFEEVLTEVKRLLRPSGFITFASLGPDTLGEINYAWSQVDDQAHVHPHVHPFVDMHFIGDALLRLGFSKPIVDTDWVTVEYPNVETVLGDLKKEGFSNIVSRRRKSLTGKNRFLSFKEMLWQSFNRNGILPINFEIIYGFAWAPSNESSIHVRPPSLSK